MEADVDADAPASLPGSRLAARGGRRRARPRGRAAPRAERPVVMAGTGLYWARGEKELQALCGELQIPVFLNGLARGCVPADDPSSSRAREGPG